MRRIGLFTAFCLTLLSFVAASSPVVAAPQYRPAAAKASSQMQRIVELVNLRRREAGLKPLTVNATLMACAQRYSEVQAAQAGISHTGPDGSSPGQRLKRCGYNWRHFGENLAAGYSDADSVVAAWMASPGHRKVILHARVAEIGLGVAHRDQDPSRYYDYFVLAVGMRR